MPKNKILVTGAGGQIGQALCKKLIDLYGAENVVTSDIRTYETDAHFEFLDITKIDQLKTIVNRHNIKQIYHLAAILSANGEANPEKIWAVNMDGLLNVLKVASDEKIDKVFFPSSIAVFGNHIDKNNCGQFTVQQPTTLYGITKSAGENWCHYYFSKYGLDVRSLRYPGIVGPDALPGGGTTDYAVHIFHEAIKSNKFTCYLKPNTDLPMIYMTDAINATIKLMEAPKENIKVRTSYNIQGITFNPAEISESIKAHIPEFTINYMPDFRQAIADSWPSKMNDTEAKKDWNWKPEVNLELMTELMINHIK